MIHPHVTLYTLLTNNANNNNHCAGILFLLARLLASHYYSHYEHGEYYEHEVQVPSFVRERLQKDLEFDLVRWSRQQHETRSARERD